MKILIITMVQSFSIGGIEKYNKNIALIFKKLNHNVDEYAFIGDSNTTPEYYNNCFFVINRKNFDKKSFFFRSFFYRKTFIKKINEFLNNANYDLIINCTNCNFSKISSNDNYFWVQHFDERLISNGYVQKTFKNILIGFAFKTLSFLFNFKNPLINSKNVVTYYDGYISKKYLKQKTNYYFIPLSYNLSNKKYDYKYFLEKKNKKMMYLGRIENRQKDISYLVNNFKNIDYYGPVIDNYLINDLKEDYKGSVDYNDLENLVFKNHSFTIIASHYEGLGGVLIESLCSYTPIIVSNNIKSSSFLVNNKNGFLFDKENPNKLIEKIKNLKNEEYWEMCLNSFSFAKTHFSKEIFEEKWISILNKFNKIK